MTTLIPWSLILGPILMLALITMLLTKHRTFSEAVGATIYWLGLGALLIMALLGVVAFGSILSVCIILVIACALLMAIGFVPMMIWAAIFDQAKTANLIADIKKAINAPAKGN